MWSAVISGFSGLPCLIEWEEPTHQDLRPGFDPASLNTRLTMSSKRIGILVSKRSIVDGSTISHWSSRRLLEVKSIPYIINFRSLIATRVLKNLLDPLNLEFFRVWC